MARRLDCRYSREYATVSKYVSCSVSLASLPVSQPAFRCFQYSIFRTASDKLHFSYCKWQTLIFVLQATKKLNERLGMGHSNIEKLKLFQYIVYHFFALSLSLTHTQDGKRSAQFEQTLMVTETGYEILTLRPDGDGKPHFMTS